MIFIFLKAKQEEIYLLQRGQAQPHVYSEDLAKLEIPLPPLKVQQQIVSEIEKIEKEVEVLEQELAKISEAKKTVLNKYL
jgi:type I restriction enzyme M protein